MKIFIFLIQITVYQLHIKINPPQNNFMKIKKDSQLVPLEALDAKYFPLI